jgi:hypothetical protein
VIDGLKAKNAELEQQLQAHDEKQCTCDVEEGEERRSMEELQAENVRLKKEYLQVIQGQLEHAQAQNEELTSEVGTLTSKLETVERDYEVLVHHKPCQYLGDPQLKEPDKFARNETRDLQQALVQAQHLLELEHEQHIKAGEVLRERETESTTDSRCSIVLRAWLKTIPQRSRISLPLPR